MTRLFAPAELFTAYSYAVDGSDANEPLPAGTHVRIFAGLGGSFPLAPFAIFPVRLHGGEPQHVHLTDERGSPIADVPGNRTIELTPVYGDDESERTVRAEIGVFPEWGLHEAQLLDAHGRVIAARREPRYLFAAPSLPKFQVRGEFSSVSVATNVVRIEDVLGSPFRVVDVLGLPTQNHAWYLGLHDRTSALWRVADGAPTRLNAMDQPDGPFDPVDPDAEQARVEALLAAGRFGGGFEQLIAAIVGDETTPPWSAMATQHLGERDQVAQLPLLGTLQMAALDPGLARYLGFATRIGHLPDLEAFEGWGALAVVGLFAIDPALGDRLPLLHGWLSAPDPDEPRLLDMLIRALADLAGESAHADIHALIAATQARGFTVRTAVAVTAPVPPWRPPRLSEHALDEHRWQPSNGVEPSAHYRATFSFAEAPLSALVAVGADFGAGWTSRHGTVDVAAGPPLRATPRIFGHETQPADRLRAVLRPGISASLRAAGLVADEDIPADAGTVSYRFAASDFFGRFGEPVERTVEPPPRPAPPPPVLRYELDLRREDPHDLPPVGALSPGSLRLIFAVPDPPPAPAFDPVDDPLLRNAIIVPSLASLAAGSRPIASAHVTVDGRAEQLDVASPGFAEFVMPLPALEPQATAEVTIEVAFRDTEGLPSDTVSATFPVNDRRPPRPIPTGIGLFWTAGPGPGPDVALQLTWVTAPHARCRVYMTDARGLGLTADELAEQGSGVPASRARIAAIGSRKVLGGAVIDRTRFRLLADDVEADATGRVNFETSLPRSLDAVQFLRIVPLGREGGEAPFDACGIVPVVVPESRRPPPPRLDGTVDPETGEATLSVVADSFDAVVLRRDEPGLFDPAIGEAAAPQFRIRRAVAAIADPVYARHVASGDLALASTSGVPVVFSATATDTNDGRGLEPFVRYVYWADVRLPPERRLPVGVMALDAGVSAVDPAGAASAPRPMSLPSAARTLMRVPATAPAAPDVRHISARKVVAAAGAVTLDVTLTDPPVAHARAIGPYRLAIWTQWPGAPIEPATAEAAPPGETWSALLGGTVSASVAPPPAGVLVSEPLTLRLAYVDPIGRLGSLVSVVVP